LEAATAGAEAVHLDAVAHNFVVGSFADLVDDVLNIREMYVFGCAAAQANEVMVMSEMAGAVANGAVAEHDAAEEALIDKDLDRAIDSCAADRRQLGCQLLGGEIVLPVGDVLDYLEAGVGDLEALVPELVNQTFDRR
jgi:hypothetical protein